MTLKRILIGIAGLAFMAAAVLFVLDRTIFAPVAVSNTVPTAPALAAQPQAATSSGELNAPVTNTTNSNAQLYRIDATQSEVHYEVDETLFTQNNKLNTAIGRTKGVAGDLRIDFTDPAKSQLGTFV
ncbi:MAG TPA: hypothetical protein VFK30_05380, partial [Anaerolineae bacterium]|nr:hypothetical protein [Anaerolineae bacterium]